MSKKRISCSDALFLHKVKYTCMLHQSTPNNADSTSVACTRKSTSAAYLREIKLIEQIISSINAEENELCYLTESNFRRLVKANSCNIDLLFGGLYIKLVEFKNRSPKFPRWGILLKEIDIG